MPVACRRVLLLHVVRLRRVVLLEPWVGGRGHGTHAKFVICALLKIQQHIKHKQSLWVFEMLPYMYVHAIYTVHTSLPWLLCSLH